MGKRTSHAPGTFSWVDLATTDAASAKSFYGGLFGWETDGGDYTICRLDGDAVCGLFERAGAPSWTSYVTVADVDAVAARAEQHGGAALDAASDVLDAGRMAVLEDPQGAVFAVWEPRARIGAERVNDAGCLCMNELATSDLDAARSFYEGLFGWTTEMVPTGPDDPPMGLAHNDGRLNASLGPVEDGSPPHWRPYFTVESVVRSLERVRELGGEPLAGPLEIFDGTIAIVRDPQGAVFALFGGEVDP